MTTTTATTDHQDQNASTQKAEEGAQKQRESTNWAALGALTAVCILLVAVAYSVYGISFLGMEEFGNYLMGKN